VSYGLTAVRFRRAGAYQVRHVGFPPCALTGAPIFIQPSSAAFYNPQQHFCDLKSLPVEIFAACPIPAIHSNAGDAKALSHREIGGFSMTSRPNEAAIDEIVASCNGDMRGALKALLLVNEQLEAELQQLHAVVAYGGLSGSGSNVLH
jgi:hypothetical protein